MWTTSNNPNWSFDNYFTWENINEGWFGLGVTLIAVLLLFFAIGFWYRGGSRNEVQGKLENEREVIKHYRQALKTLIALDPSLATAFPAPEKSDYWDAWGEKERDRLIGTGIADIDLQKLAELWPIIEAQNTREGNNQALKSARKALKEARNAR